MYGILIFVFTLVLILAESAIGFFRGWKKSLIRVGIVMGAALLLLIITPLIAEPLGISLIGMFYKKVSSMEELITTVMKQYIPLENVDFLYSPLVGIALSAIIPVVFALLYWVVKFLSWVTGLIITLVKNKRAKAVIIETKPEDVKTDRKTTDSIESDEIRLEPIPVLTMKSKLIGAVIGFVLALISGAITLAPAILVAKAVQGNENQTALNALIGEAAGDILVSYEKSPAKYIYRFTGVEVVVGGITNAASKVEVDGRTYAFKKEITYLMQYCGTIKELLDNAKTGNTGSVVGMMGDLTTMFGEFEYYTDEDKLTLLGETLDKISETEYAKENVILSKVLGSISLDDVETVQQDMEAYTEIARVLDENGVLTGSTEDMTALMEETETMDTLVDNVYELSNSTKVMQAIANEVCSEATNGQVTQIIADEISPEVKDEKAEVKETLQTFNELLAQMEESSQGGNNRSEEEQAALLEKVESLEGNPLIGQENYEALYEYVKFN